MNNGKQIPFLKEKIKIREILFIINPRNSKVFGKYGYYFFISSLILLITSTILLLNGYLRLFNPPIYNQHENIINGDFLAVGYAGVFLITAFSPLPDYFIVPILGYMAYLGLLNIWLVVLISSIADVILMFVDYLGGRFAGRAIVVKFLGIFKVKTENLTNAEEWIGRHGFASIFISTFIPFFKHVVSVAAGTLRMNVLIFLLSNFAGFSIRFLFLALLGYRGIYLFSPSFDYETRWVFYLLGIFSLVMVIYYIEMKLQILKKISEDITGLFNT